MKGWLLGSVDGDASGLVPANYVKVIGKRLPKATKPDVIGDAAFEKAFN